MGIGPTVDLSQVSEARSDSAPPTPLPPRRPARAALAYLGTAVLCIFVVSLVMHITWRRFHVPFYAHSDAYFYSALVKNIASGHFLVNPWVGAPGIQRLYDFPLGSGLHLLLLRMLSVFSRNFAVVLNGYFLLAFPLIAVLSLLTFRQLGISYPVGVVGSVLYAFLPYHFYRGEGHLTFGTYYMVPPLVLVLLWLTSGEPFFRWDYPPKQTSEHWITGKGTASLVICALVASDTAYAAFFSAFFLIVAGALARWRYGHSRLRTAGVLLGTLLLVFALNLSPTFLYHLRHGSNPEAVQRQVQEAEIYGLKVAQLVLPVTMHRVHALAELKAKYNLRGMPFWINENDWSALGVVGTFGFLLLLVYLLFRSGGKRCSPLLETLSLVNFAGLLLGTVGGFGVVFALLVSPDIRGYNRICTYIAFFSMIAAMWELEQLSLRLNRINRLLIYPLLSLLLVFGTLDQTTKFFIPDYRAAQAEYASDGLFMYQIQSSLPDNAMVFQLPYVPYPESAPVHDMADYDHFRAYLHSTKVRWSYGAMKGRPEDLWQRRVTAQPAAEMAQTLALAGFSGIYINRKGYADGARQLQAQFASILDTAPLVSPNQRLVFFSLLKLQQQLRERYPGQEWETMHRAALSPLQLP